MRPLGVLGAMDPEWFRSSKVLGCPHPHIPSDHLPLLVEIEMLCGNPPSSQAAVLQPPPQRGGAQQQQHNQHHPQQHHPSSHHHTQQRNHHRS